MAALLPDDLTARARRIIEEWAPLLGLGGWSIGLAFDEEKDQATAYAEPRYKLLRIHLNPKLIADDDVDIEELVVHELCHALTWRLWDFAERLVLRHIAPESQADHRWWLEEAHEEAVTAIGLALVNLKRQNP